MSRRYLFAIQIWGTKRIAWVILDLSAWVFGVARMPSSWRIHLGPFEIAWAKLPASVSKARFVA